MNDPICYKAFGLVLESEFPIMQLPEVERREPDVRIVRADLSALPLRRGLYSGPEGCYFRGQDLCTHRITGGRLIEVDPREDYDPSKLGVYLMGTCMGAIHYQRGLMMLHGSCVTDGHRSILLTGDSGAGKSTLAAEFLRRGWKLITDDVSVVYDPEGLPLVQSSNPSQKLWRDALDRYERRELIEQHSLQRHFQRCVTLSTKVPMVAVTRIDGEDCAGRMYDLITEHLSGLYQNDVKV